MSRALAIPEPLKQRQARASDPKTSAWVSANAGSGKTHVLTQRVLRLLLDGTPPAQILCLAYTKAAAANMADRVFSKLAPVDEPQRQRPGEGDRRMRRGRAESARPHLRAAIVRAHHREPRRSQDSDAARLCREAAAALSFRGQRPGPFQGSRRSGNRSGCSSRRATQRSSSSAPRARARARSTWSRANRAQPGLMSF